MEAPLDVFLSVFGIYIFDYQRFLGSAFYIKKRAGVSTSARLH